MRDINSSENYVIEMCSNCETEIEIRWDVKKDGFKAYCPKCGRVLMLCDECYHRNGEFYDDCDWNSKTGGCRFNPRIEKHVRKQRAKACKQCAKACKSV